jgi:hypothetical protein
MQRPDPELLPIQRPRCPKCQLRMVTIAATPPDEKGFESRTFECVKCHHVERRSMAADPFKTSAAGWLAGELGKAH